MVKLSVVLATYNRAETLRRTLDHLAKQNLDRTLFEVIVIDDGSPDNTRAVIERFAATSPFSLTCLGHANRGPGYTQNRGIRQAKGAVLLLIADDIWLDRGALRAHLEYHERHPEPEVALLGQVMQSPELAQSAFLRNWDPWGLADLRGATELPFTMFWACNISVKRDFLLRHGMFQETSGPAGHHAHHDTELGYRLHQRGLRIYYSESAFGYHYHPATFEQTLRQWYERGLNWTHFRKQVPAPETLVLGRVLTLRTFREFVRALRGPNRFPPSERALWRHVLRTVLRNLAFNRSTVPVIWNPLLAHAETTPWLERLVNRRIYRALMHYHFERGIHEGERRFGA